ncbi:MAG: LacI family DNA-binding transcriptional regulator [Armatimonadota bacterium]
MTTIRNLAALAGVSIGTVSLALRDSPRISATTRARIQALAREYHYVPNRLSQAIFSGRSSLIGLLTPAIDNPYFVRVIKGVLAHAFEMDCQPVTLEFYEDISRVSPLCDVLCGLKVDGLLLLGAFGTQPLPVETLLRLRSRRIPLVVCEALPVAEAVDRVMSDEPAMARDIMTCLTGLGHRRIIYLGPTTPMHPRAQALHAAGLPEASVVECLRPIGMTPHEEPLLPLLARLEAIPTAVILWNDYDAARLLRECLLAGLHMPEDLSIISYGNATLCGLTVPALTSMEQLPEQVGREALDLLLQRMVPDVDRPPTGHVFRALPGNLVIRESCAAPRTLDGDRRLARLLSPG